MSPLTTHVLDIAAGKPARGVAVTLEIRHGPGQWAELAHGVTDADGRIAGFVPPLAALEREVYRLRFATGAYFKVLGVGTFYPEVERDLPDLRPGAALSRSATLEPIRIQHVSR